MPRYNPTTVFPWINMYFELLQSSFPDEYRFKSYDETQLKQLGHTRICFSNLVFFFFFYSLLRVFLLVSSIAPMVVPLLVSMKWIPFVLWLTRNTIWNHLHWHSFFLLWVSWSVRMLEETSLVVIFPIWKSWRSILKLKKYVFFKFLYF